MSDRTTTPSTTPVPTSRAGRDPRALIGLLVSDAISLTGNVVCLIALPLYVLSSTGSVMKVAVVSAAGTIPVVLGGVLGVVVDKAGYRRVSILADAVGALTMAAIPVLDWSGLLPFWALVALVFATGLLDTPGQSARVALMPEAADLAHLPLERVMGWHGAVERSSRLVGAPLAGFLVAAFGAAPVFVIDAASFALSATVVALLVPRWLRPTTDPAADSAADGGTPPATASAPQRHPGTATAYWASLRASLAYLVRHPLLRAVVIMVLITNALDAGKSQVVLPMYATELLGGAQALGLLVGAFGAGSLVGSLVFSAIGPLLPRRWTYALGFLLCGAPVYLVFAAEPGLPACLTAMVISGLAAGSINPIIGTVMLTEVPASMRASVSGLIGAGCWAAMPLGALGAGLLVDTRGLVVALLAMGALYLAVTLWPVWGRVWAGLDRRPPAS